MSIELKILKELYPFKTMLDPHIRLLAESGDVRDLNKGEVVFEEGDNDGLSIYLLAGRLTGKSVDSRVREFDANSERSRYAVGDFQPRRFSAVVSSAVARIMEFDRGYLEKALTWDQIARSSQVSIQGSTAESARWVFQMLKSKALLKLPAGNIERMFDRFEQVGVMPNEDVIVEGDDGDYFYVIQNGEFQVLKNTDGKNSVVATLVGGDSFGEDALISNVKRNATVRARTAGKLMRLGKDDFSELLRHPVVDWITPGRASALCSLGATLLDVRMSEEHNQCALTDSINAPLFRLRETVAGMREDIPYVVYCDTGERAASAAFILNKMGFKAYALRGGVTSVRQQLLMKRRREARGIS